MPPRTVRTTQPHNLLDLDDGQFEDLIRDLTRRLKVRWKRLEPVGRLGGDEGRDLLGIELYRRKGREWRVQVKRWKEMGPKALRAIVREAVPDPAIPPHKLIVAVACGVSSRGFKAFHDEADKLGIAEHEVWPDATINDLLREPKNTDLGAFYFGATRAIDGTTTVPLALWRSAGADLPLMGREGEIAALRAEGGDVLLIGQPGSGKTRLAVEAGDVRFLNLNADADAIADSLRVHRPRALVVDDAGFDIARLRTGRRLAGSSATDLAPPASAGSGRPWPPAPGLPPEPSAHIGQRSRGGAMPPEVLHLDQVAAVDH